MASTLWQSVKPVVWGSPWSWLQGVHPWKEVTRAVPFRSRHGVLCRQTVFHGMRPPERLRMKKIFENIGMPSYSCIYLGLVTCLWQPMYSVCHLEENKWRPHLPVCLLLLDDVYEISLWMEWLWPRPLCYSVIPVCFTWQILKAGVANGAGVGDLQTFKSLFSTCPEVVNWLALTGASCMGHLTTSSCVCMFSASYLLHVYPALSLARTECHFHFPQLYVLLEFAAYHLNWLCHSNILLF